MYWGAGPGLGLLTFAGYVFFVLGAGMVWRNRDDVYVWIHDGVSDIRRNLSRHTVIGPFYGVRRESRLVALPACFVRSLSRIPRSRNNRAVVLLLLGPLLVLLDFFI